MRKITLKIFDDSKGNEVGRLIYELPETLADWQLQKPTDVITTAPQVVANYATAKANLAALNPPITKDDLGNPL